MCSSIPGTGKHRDKTPPKFTKHLTSKYEDDLNIPRVSLSTLLR